MFKNTKLDENSLLMRFYFWSYNEISKSELETIKQDYVTSSWPEEYKYDRRMRYRDVVSDNFCPIFWKLVLAVVFSPLTMFGYLLEKAIKDHAPFIVKIVFGVAVWAFLAIGAFIIYQVGLYQASIGFLAGLLTIGVIFGLGAGLHYLIKLITNTSGIRVVGDSINIVSIKVNSFKEKYCPKITWTKNGEEIVHVQEQSEPNDIIDGLIDDLNKD